MNRGLPDRVKSPAATASISHRPPSLLLKHSSKSHAFVNSASNHSTSKNVRALQIPPPQFLRSHLRELQSHSQFLHNAAGCQCPLSGGGCVGGDAPDPIVTCHVGVCSLLQYVDLHRRISNSGNWPLSLRNWGGFLARHSHLARVWGLWLSSRCHLLHHSKIH